MTSQRKSRILDEVHESVQDLHEIGAISAGRMAEFEVWCRAPLKAISAAKIRRLRRQAQLSQTVFAALLNTRVSTVQRWECGEARPSGPALKLLNLLERKGLEAVI